MVDAKAYRGPLGFGFRVKQGWGPLILWSLSGKPQHGTYPCTPVNALVVLLEWEEAGRNAIRCKQDARG